MSTLTIDLSKIRHNRAVIKDACDARGLKLNVVLKSCQLLPQIVDGLVESSVEMISFSGSTYLERTDAKRLPHTTLLKMPAISNIDSVVRHANSSVNSEIETIRKLAVAARRNKVVHEIVIMVDLGDKREGILPDEITTFAGKIREIGARNIVVSGIGVNFGCLTDYHPSDHDFYRMREVAMKAEQALGYKLSRISVGGSILLDRLLTDGYLGAANEVRIGEAILLGTSPGRMGVHEALFGDAFIYSGEILEIKDKPNLENRKLMRRAIVNFGSLNTVPEGLQSMDCDAVYVGSTSEYTIFDITMCAPGLRAGDVLRFIPNYDALARCLISPYITHEIRGLDSSIGKSVANERLGISANILQV
ncbi:alanine racemase [Burkholderia contaminans]|uniref:alanine racemase n=1 Tax=Burkholderia contaminans TaxID=488447 RepID=UPI0015882F02|nr:alanine racemase [Burkholderia contaminans]